MGYTHCVHPVVSIIIYIHLFCVQWQCSHTHKPQIVGVCDNWTSRACFPSTYNTDSANVMETAKYLKDCNQMFERGILGKRAFINPRRACAARVTVVCLFVTVSDTTLQASVVVRTPKFPHQRSINDTLECFDSWILLTMLTSRDMVKFVSSEAYARAKYSWSFFVTFKNTWFALPHLPRLDLLAKLSYMSYKCREWCKPSACDGSGHGLN